MLFQHAAHQELVIARGNRLWVAVDQAQPLTRPRNDTAHLPLCGRVPGLAENPTHLITPVQLSDQLQDRLLTERFEQEHFVTVVPETLQVLAPRHGGRQTRQTVGAGHREMRFPVAVASASTVIYINKQNRILFHTASCQLHHWPSQLRKR